jgi:hypothetical protein
MHAFPVVLRRGRVVREGVVDVAVEVVERRAVPEEELRRGRASVSRGPRERHVSVVVAGLDVRAGLEEQDRLVEAAVERRVEQRRASVVAPDVVARAVIEQHRDAGRGALHRRDVERRDALELLRAIVRIVALVVVFSFFALEMLVECMRIPVVAAADDHHAPIAKEILTVHANTFPKFIRVHPRTIPLAVGARRVMGLHDPIIADHGVEKNQIERAGQINSQK